MKSASLNELKTELSSLSPAEVAELCLRLAKFKKENKELLTYLLFESSDPNAFIEGIKRETDDGFANINQTSLYYVKKSVRKILRTLNKYSRYSGSAQVTIEVLLYFCAKLKHSGIPFENSAQLLNLYNAQLKKIQLLIQSLHEDLQYDYGKELEKL
ncbi:MAG: hypothetical protein K1X81_11385 [Bacteroidia bacterium]|nr:hypothetical protein [Bacteroidia bacterium]